MSYDYECMNDYNNHDYHSESNYYDSDHIDSDIEDMLYTSIHHQTIDSNELSSKHVKEPSPTNTIHDELMSTPNIINERKNFKRKKLKKSKKLEKFSKFKSEPIAPKISDNYDISFGNINSNNEDIVINAENFPNISMNGYYQEANYDQTDDDIDNIVKKLPKDRRYWKVDRIDLQRERNNNHRRTKRCHNCLEFGHTERPCTNRSRKCYICGHDGHIQKACELKSICSYCFDSNHSGRKCKNKIKCNICNVVGHTNDNCTYHWRKYLTITNDIVTDSIQQKDRNDFPSYQNSNISCYNCGGSHYGHQCKSWTINYRKDEIPSPFLNVLPHQQSNHNQYKKQKFNKKQNHRNEISNKFLSNITNSNEPNQQTNDDSSYDSLEYDENLLKQSTNKRMVKKKKFTNQKSKISNGNFITNQINQSIRNGHKKSKKKAKMSNKKVQTSLIDNGMSINSKVKGFRNFKLAKTMNFNKITKFS